MFADISAIGTNETVIARLAGATLGNNINTDQVAQIRSFCANFERFSQSPRFILTIIQPEFHFDKALNTYQFREKTDRVALQAAIWPERLFVLVDHQEMEYWLPILIQRSKNSLICALMPTRAETECFHMYVLRYAKEVRFLRGRTTITKEDLGTTAAEPPYVHPYMLVLFHNSMDFTLKQPKKEGVGIITLHSSFTNAEDDDISLENLD